ncbi:ABC transporter ATP-binding protein [Halalkaliarchaeum sp. AArc-GB]|uniref:ABC transporter ATP-binding protein n=1 Tax=Halalkaliarchaeum sp. AArc-GB TaxID=3074078 RepID=UPI002866B800|nr:ABC transporter ATP-binding protein [Halalkaliarchaeum sp. AArc-GB]MDR5672190.1 ABC transporter ATP-binding protein [Halalkaliarchaeum sp. AArc-GB]
MATIQLNDVVKRFDDVVAVDGIDLTVRDGEFIVIVGPSGCGKSTTLRLISGLEDVTSGVIEIGGRDVTGLEPNERDISMVFQNYALYPHMTAKRNMTFGMKSAGDFTDEEIEQRVTEAAEILDITDLLDRKPGALSGGERQRVALGRAISRDPEVFLMDEPLSNLDAKLRVQMRAELAKLHDELQTTTVYVTHDQTEAMTLGDRVAVIDAGQIQQVDSPQRLYDFPENRFVAEFIGDPAMNMIDVTVRDGNAVHEAFSIPLPAGENTVGSGEVTAGQRSAILGIRPEDFYLASEYPDMGETTFPATVTVTEPLGDSLLLYCRIADTEFKVQAEPRSTLQPGDEVELTYDPARLHLFDPETGDAIYHSESAPGSEEQLEQPVDE